MGKSKDFNTKKVKKEKGLNKKRGSYMTEYQLEREKAKRKKKKGDNNSLF